MRKHFILILLTVALISALTGCGEKKNNDTQQPQAQGDVQGAENENMDGIPSNSAFRITLNGDDEAVFTLTHEAIGKLETNQDQICK